MVTFALAHGTARVRRPCAQVHPSTRARPSGDKAAPSILFAGAFPRRRLLGCPRRPGLAVAGQAAHAVAKGRGTDSLAATDTPYHRPNHARTHAREPTADAVLAAAHGVEPGSAMHHRGIPSRPPTLPSGSGNLTRVHTPAHAIPLAHPRPARVRPQHRRRADAAAPTPAMASRDVHRPVLAPSEPSNPSIP
jgi:hypothetical protein